MEEFYSYEGHKLWWWLFQLNLALLKDHPNKEANTREAIELVEDILYNSQKIWPDKLYKNGSILW